MAIVVKPSSRGERWMAELGRQMPEEDLRLWPDIGDPGEAEYLLAWRMDASEMATLVNLKAIFSLGAGTEQWQHPGIDLPVVRLADPEMANEMAGYCVAWVLRHQRRFREIEEQQRNEIWQVLPHKQPEEFRVGVLGYGAIGSRVGRAFVDLGYRVNAWTRSPRAPEAGVTSFVGGAELDPFLGASDAVINVLPSTPATIGLIDADRLESFAAGSVFVNVGRGTVLSSESDLLDALDSGPLAAAVLDVTVPEPPVAGSRLYTHPGVTVTPHISGMTQIGSAARLIAANVRRLRAGEAAFPMLDRERGY